MKENSDSDSLCANLSTINSLRSSKQHLATASSVFTKNGGRAFVVLHKFKRFGPSSQTSFLRSKVQYFSHLTGR